MNVPMKFLQCLCFLIKYFCCFGCAIWIVTKFSEESGSNFILEDIDVGERMPVVVGKGDQSRLHLFDVGCPGGDIARCGVPGEESSKVLIETFARTVLVQRSLFIFRNNNQQGNLEGDRNMNPPSSINASSSFSSVFAPFHESFQNIQLWKMKDIERNIRYSCIKEMRTARILQL